MAFENLSSMINLFEYQNKVELPFAFKGLDEFLDDIWVNREKSAYFRNEEEERIEVQQFIQYLHRTNQIKSNNYVGVIHFKDKKINLLPKIFYESEKVYTTNDINGVQQHILWWLSYCRKIKFPNYQTSLGNQKSDFFEVLIYLFSKYTRTLLNNSIYQQYEEVNKELPFIKGRLNTSAYITENISRGRWHQLNCTYDAFVFDNKFNRIIKYVTMMLFNASNNIDNKKYLREILFVLDEVSDVRASAEDCASIKFNPMFGDFETVRDYCYLFLNNSISFNYKNELKLFAFLVPMEKLFEDFIFGFIDKEIEEITPKAQAGNIYLDEAQSFKLKPDLLLDVGPKKFIADVKYKIVYSDKNDPKKGVSQNDLYQMLAYAVRFKIDEILLFYPNTLKGNHDENKSEILLKDELADGRIITIKTFQLPVINKKLFDQNYSKDNILNDIFEETKVNLIEKIKTIVLHSFET